MIYRLFYFGSVVALSLFISGAFFATPRLVMAQGVGVTQIAGTVLDQQRHPLEGAQVRLSGPTTETTTTRADGSFTFVNVPGGTYRLDIAKGGFTTSAQDDIVTTAGSTTNLSFTLLPASLTSLTEIGHVSVNTRNGANAINTTPASIVNVPGTTFTDQGQLTVNQVLNEQPGITVGIIAGGGAGQVGTSPLAEQIASVRGGLPYETESLIDGHDFTGGTGCFSPNFLSPYMLQNVEIVKGPGVTSPSVNYAINGSVNYRTLEPTLKPQSSVDFTEDQYGGNLANFRATGTLPGGRLSYAFDYETQGTQGFDRGFNMPVLLGANVPLYLNGNPISEFAGLTAPAGTHTDSNFNLALQDELVACCQAFPQYFNQRNELGKIRYEFTPSTALTVTYLGAQSIGSDASDHYFGSCGGEFVFDPPAGYTGSIPAGPLTVFIGGYDQSSNSMQYSNLFETEFHTPLGKTATFQFRQYSASTQSADVGPGQPGSSWSETMGIYGAVYYNGASSPTIFNGEPVTVSEGPDAYREFRSYSNFNGYTAEIDKQAGDDLISLSYDEEKSTYLGTYTNYGSPILCVGIPGGSSQTYESVMARIQFTLGQRLNGTISDNFGRYSDVFSQDGGLTFLSATHTYETPRLSLTWRPNANTSFRGSIGASIAPPYLNLLNNNLSVSAGAGLPPSYFTVQGNSGDVAPETAFGFNVGFDTRVHSPYTVLSFDVYQTLLRNQFLNATFANGTFTASSSNCTNAALWGETAPLYVTKTENLGHSEYEGIEVSLHRTPPTGWGYRIQGSLMRAFAYDLPAGFYNTASCTNCTNLGILPNENFQASGPGYNAISTVALPYSMGYGEINYRGHNGAYFLAGVTYYGPNNSYQEPAFEVVNMSFTQPLTRRTSLQLSMYNVTNTYSSIYLQLYHSPIYVPLVTGQVGATAGNVIGPSIARLTLHIDM